MLVIGLTGGIGTGKSEVASILAKLGATVINADQLGHEAYIPQSDIWRELVSVFGSGILHPNGEIDRKRLGAIVFSDPRQLARLNRIVHPRIHQMIADKIEELRTEGVAVVVLDAALLLEGGWESSVDEVWVTTAPEHTVVQRIQARNGLSEAEVRKRINSQMPTAQRLAKATTVIDNSGDLDALERAVEKLWDSRVVKRIEQA